MASTTTQTDASPDVAAAESVEDQLGISVYLSPDHQGFSAVLKARYSDFVVHEVGVDGAMAQLDSFELAAPKDEEEVEEDEDDSNNTKKRKRREQEEAQEKAAVAAATSNSTAEVPWSDLETELGKMVGNEASKKVISFLQQDAQTAKEEAAAAVAAAPADDDNNKQELYVALPPIPDKDTRRQVHQWIKSSAMHSLATADTADGRIRLWPLRHESKMPNHGQFNRSGGRQGQRTNSGAPRVKRPTGYLQFVLYKENCDTHTAIKQITLRMGQGGGRGGRGGRGRGGRGGGDRVRVGYAGMKDKRGVTTQFCTLQNRSPHEIDWVNQQNTKNNNNHQRGGGGHTSKGGMALVRVGNYQFVKEELRLGRLQGNHFDVVLRNVQLDNNTEINNTESKFETIQPIILKAADNLAHHGFINYFGTQRFGKFKDTHLAGMALLQGDFERITNFILRPKPESGEYPNVVAARETWQKRFDNAATKDAKGEKAQIEADCAKSIVRSFGRFMASEVAILESLARHPLDYKRAFSCINKTMRMMFLHAVQSLLWNKVASYRIQSLGREVIVGDVVYADNYNDKEMNNTSESKQTAAVHLVTAEDVTAKKYTMVNVILPLLGTKSVKPNNECGALFDTLLKDNGLTMDMFHKIQDRDLASCPGDYRKLICRPTDVVVKVAQYNDPVQPLLQTDLMKLNNIPIELASSSSESSLIGAVVGFTLPSSAYATIALRELMKKPTSSEYQKELGLGGGGGGAEAAIAAS